MPDQVLQIGKGQFMHVTRSFRDGGRDAEWAMVGGQRIRISDRVMALPEIFQNGNGFFYKDGSPVNDAAHVAYLPEPYKTQAIKWIERGKAKPAEIFEDKEVAKAVAETPKKKIGRPKKADTAATKKAKIVEIKDEQSYLDAGGTLV